MTGPPNYINHIKPGLELPWWFTHEMPAINDDFTQRVVSLPQHARWQATQVPGIDLRVLEHIPGSRPRLSAQLRLEPANSPAQLGNNPDLEILIQRGELESAMGVYPSGLYLRLPLNQHDSLQSLTVRCTGSRAPSNWQTSSSDRTNQHEDDPLESALLYIAAGQMLKSDTEQRVLNTHDDSRWLPGPEEGVQVMPLHGHHTGNVMLIRWNTAVTFKPRLDPMGEELLVLRGAVHDADGEFPAGSWIRNPVAAWQNWGAEPGTVIYYKNGHFTPVDNMS